MIDWLIVFDWLIGVLLKYAFWSERTTMIGWKQFDVFSFFKRHTGVTHKWMDRITTVYATLTYSGMCKIYQSNTSQRVTPKHLFTYLLQPIHCDNIDSYRSATKCHQKPAATRDIVPALELTCLQSVHWWNGTSDQHQMTTDSCQYQTPYCNSHSHTQTYLLIIINRKHNKPDISYYY